jgi:4-hydroxy-tetrahydrodipicolinate reductase
MPSDEVATASFGGIRVGVHGATGRMGTRIIQLLQDNPALRLAAAVDRPDHPRLGEDIGAILGLGRLDVPLTSSIDRPLDVVIDFSTPAATMSVLGSCVAQRVALVVGTTGLEPRQREELERAAGTIPVLAASNFSKAVNLLVRLVDIAARALGDEADIEVVERHHHFKKDAPSGTALTLAEVAAKGIGSDRFVHGRHGQVGERPRGEIGLHALRTGDNPGEHMVVFGLMGECLELSHRALNRDGFARGAIDAAIFLAGKPPGRYTMDDLLSSSGPA